MEPRILKGLQAEFVTAKYKGSDPGFVIYGRNVLVKMDECASASSGGVILTEQKIEQMTEASETGCICGIGPGAFRIFPDGTRWDGPRPEVGDRVYVERYAGIMARGRDGAVYRMMGDGCIYAGLIPDEPVEQEKAA